MFMNMFFKNKFNMAITLCPVFLFLLISCGTTSPCDTASIVPIMPSYTYPDSIVYNDVSYVTTNVEDKNTIINNKLIGFIINSSDEAQFKKDYPDTFYYVYADTTYYRHNGRIPLYSVLGDDKMDYISTPEKVVYGRVL